MNHTSLMHVHFVHYFFYLTDYIKNNNPNPDKPEPKNKFITKVRRHEILNVVLFRAFPSPDLGYRPNRLMRAPNARYT